MTPAPKRSGLPDSVRRAVERTFQSTFGSGGLSRDRAQELVDEVLRHAEAGAVRAGRGVREAGQKPREAAAELGERVREALHDLTTGETEDLKSEVDRLSRRVDRLERELKERERSRSSKPGGRGGSSASTAQRGKEKRKS
jgi:polyhydroxyalkanoate synthesis regulator phasin